MVQMRHLGFRRKQMITDDNRWPTCGFCRDSFLIAISRNLNREKCIICMTSFQTYGRHLQPLGAGSTEDWLFLILEAGLVLFVLRFLAEQGKRDETGRVGRVSTAVPTIATKALCKIIKSLFRFVQKVFCATCIFPCASAFGIWVEW